MTPVEQNAIAFRELVSTKLPVFRRMAYRQLGNVADAEDAVQDALLLAHRNLSKFRGDSSLSTWLGTIVVNSARMQRRGGTSRLRAATIPVHDDLFTEELSDSKPNAEELVHESTQWGRVAAAIGKLNPTLREPLLSWLNGDSIKEISARMNRPEGTIKASLFRAKAQLRNRVGATR